MPNTHKILIVDDDPQLRDALTDQLALHEEFEAAAAENGTKGVQVAKEGQIDLVIMDVGLPDIDGREAVRILRRNGFKAPIIMLTGNGTDSDTILGLESGASQLPTATERRLSLRISHKQAGEAVRPRPAKGMPLKAEDYAFFFKPLKTASAVIGICRTRTPTAL